MSPLPIIHRIFQSFLLAFLALLCGAAYAAPGSTIATILTPFPGGTDFGSRVVVQPDGKFIVVGSAFFGTEQFAMTRYNANGTIDTSYGARHIGTQLEPIGSGNGEGKAAAFDASGRLVVAGHVRNGEKDRFGLARFHADGTLDTDFGGGGSAIDVGPGDAGGYAMAIQGDGKILVAGYSMVGNHQVMTVVRYTDTDLVDSDYGNGGSYVAADMGANVIATAAALQSDGKLVIAGGGPSGLVLQRITDAGTLDPTFGTSGTVTIAGLNAPTDMVVYPDNRILVVGNAAGATQLAVVRVSANGVQDTTFGSSGVATITNATGATGGGILLDGTNIVVTGTFSSNISNSQVIARFTDTGALDAAFGSGGKTVFTAATSSSGAGLAKRLGGGYYVVGGDFLPASGVPDTLSVAYASNGTRDATFNNNTGYRLDDLGSSPAMANGSVVQPDGKIVAVGRICSPNVCDNLVPQSLDKAVVVRYLADGTLDTGFGGGKGYFIIPGLISANAVALDGSNRIVVGGVGLSTFNSSPARAMAFARVNADGTSDGTFGSGGSLIVPATSADNAVSAVVVQGSGRIVGAGFIKPTTWKDTTFVGVTSAGAVDTSFGSSGTTVVAVSTGDDEVTSLIQQTDGKLVAGGWGQLTGSLDGMSIVRLTAGGAPDTTFGNPNGYVTIAFPSSSRGFGVGMQGSNIVVGGQVVGASNYDFAVARVTSNGTLDTTFGTGGKESDDISNNDNHMYALAVLSNGKIVGAGDDFGSFGVVRYNANGGLDATFGTGGNSTIPVNFMAGADYAKSLSVATNGDLYLTGNASNAFGMAIVAGDSSTGGGATAGYLISSSQNPSTSGQPVTLTVAVSGSAGTPSGSVTFKDNNVAIGACTSLTLASGTAQCPISSLTDGSHSITVTYSGDANYLGSTSSAFTQTVNPQSTSGALQLSPASLAFGGESMGTTSPGQTITVTNTGGTTVTVSGVAVTSQFGQSNNCSSLAAGDSCQVTVTFSPAPAAGAVNSRTSVTGTLSITSNASGSPATAPLSGSGEKSLVTHYYRSILRRAPDSAGHDFWESEAARVVSLGANVNETWYALAMSFFNTPEYANFHTDNAGFLTDLYLTFFNRAPDSAGFNFWMDQMNQGMPRDGVLANMMFSPEFKNFTEAIFGNTTVRAEVDMTMDMYRGTLARLPDSAGFNFYLGEFRKAQCQSADAVRAEADTVSSGFLNSQEYANRQRTNGQYMADLYNTFMRRGPDTAGINFYIGQLDSGAQTREAIRQQFVASPEFSNRVTNVANAGCTQ